MRRHRNFSKGVSLVFGFVVVFSLLFACIYATMSSLFTVSPTFLFSTIPTAGSILSSFCIRPPPKYTDSFPISSAFSCLTITSCFVVSSILLSNDTGKIYWAFSNLFVSKISLLLSENKGKYSKRKRK